MATTTTHDKTTSIANQKAPPIDLNALHTPHKLAAFVVNVPSLKHDYSFLFNEENKNNSNNQQTQPFNKGLNLNPQNHITMNLIPPTIIRKTKSKSSKKKRDKKKSKLNKKLKQHEYKINAHLNIDEKDSNIYNAEIDSVGPTNNTLPGSPGAPSSKTNVLYDQTQSHSPPPPRPPQHISPHIPPQQSNRDINNTQIKPRLPEINSTENINEPVNLNITNNNDTNNSHYHTSQVSSSSLMGGNNTSMNMASLMNMSNMSIPEPDLLIGDVIGDIPKPMEANIPSIYDTDIQPDITIPTSEVVKYEVSMIDTPTIDTIDSIGVVSIDKIKLTEQYSEDLSTDDEYDIDHDHDHDDSDTDADEVSGSDSDSEYSTDDDDDDNNVLQEFGLPTRLEEEEENICMRIGKVLYENSWTGDMIASSTEFSRREYNALLDVGFIPTDSYISNLVWKIIFYSQKKTKDDLIDEDKIHIKWYWYDSNDMESDWKWRKYNVIICQWITNQYQIYLKDQMRNNCHEIDFMKCQEKFETDHKKNQKKNQKSMRNKPGMMEEKKEYLSGNESDNEFEEKGNSNNNKKKKITIDPYFDKNNNYNHFLVIEKHEKNILIWHKITNKSNENEYYREIRLDHKLFDIKPDMIVHNYQPNPSPFAIPPQLAVDT